MAFAVEHANAIHALFISNSLHDPVGGLAIIVQHELPGGTGEAAGELIGTQNHRLYQLPLLCAEVQVAAYRADGDDENRQG